MTTSGSSDFNLNANQIITEAFDICGIGSEGESISADMFDRANRSLNLLVKTWGTRPHLWTKTAQSVPLVAGQASYVLTPKPMRVLSARRRVTSSSLDTPLTPLSRSDYDDIPNKATASIPVNFYYDPQTTTGTLYVWPTPSVATAAAMTLELTYLRRMDDFDTTIDDADLPQEWLQALSYALASELALKYGVAPDIRAEIAQRAGMLYEALKDFDEEPNSFFLEPELR